MCRWTKSCLWRLLQQPTDARFETIHARKRPRALRGLFFAPYRGWLEVNDYATGETPAVQIIGNFRIVTTEERIAVRGDRGVAIGRKKTRIRAQAEVAGQVIFHAAAQAVGERSVVGRAVAVGVVREANTGRHVRTQAMIAAAQHVQTAELILIDVGVIGVEIGIGENIMRAVRGVVAIEHELRLKIFGDVVIEETTPGKGVIDAQPVDRRTAGGTDRVRAAGFPADKGRDFKTSLGTGR